MTNTASVHNSTDIKNRFYVQINYANFIFALLQGAVYSHMNDF